MEGRLSHLFLSRTKNGPPPKRSSFRQTKTLSRPTAPPAPLQPKTSSVATVGATVWPCSPGQAPRPPCCSRTACWAVGIWSCRRARGRSHRRRARTARTIDQRRGLESGREGSGVGLVFSGWRHFTSEMEHTVLGEEAMLLSFLMRGLGEE